MIGGPRFLTAVILALVGAALLVGCGGEAEPTGAPPVPEGTLAEQFRSLLPAEQQGATSVGSAKCAECHRAESGGSRQEEGIPTIDFAAWEQTRHAQVGLTCEQCHGPGSKHASAPSEENILTFPKVVHSVVCGQCHANTYQEWLYSGHKEVVETPVEEAVQQPARYGKQFRCISCHSGLFRTEIVEKGVNVDALTDGRVAELADETLSQVPFTASCATCHDPHRPTGKLTGSGKEKQLRHAVFNTDTAPIGPGAPAAQHTTFEHLCGQCHNGRGANPSDTALQTGTARPNMHDSPQFNMLMGIGGYEGAGPVQRNTAHATAPGQCTHCHMPNGRHSFTVSFEGCSPCHTPTDAAERTRTVKAEIQAGLYALRSRLGRWAQSTFQGQPDYASVDAELLPILWDYSVLITTQAQEMGKTITLPANHQARIPIEVKRARHNYYFILRDKCFGPHNAPYARHLLNVANQQLDALGVTRAAPERLSLARIQAVLEADLERLRRLVEE